MSSKPALPSSSSPEQYKHIPAELQALPQWVCWRLMPGAGRTLTKVPYQPNGMFASVDNPLTWSSFAEAVAAAPRFSGVGFVFKRGGGYAGIDLDHSEDAKIVAAQIRIFEGDIPFDKPRVTRLFLCRILFASWY